MNIPNNSISEEIKEIVEIYNELKDEEEFYFNPPASENEIKSWEIEKKITIPEQYKEWLMFSNGSRILGLAAEFYELDRIVTEPVLENNNLVIIGSLVGDGEVLCFCKDSGKIVTDNHGEIIEYGDFKSYLKFFISTI